jgi:hypothetical protein
VSTPRNGTRLRIALLTLGLVVALGLLTVWIVHPWEWGWMDDPGFVLQMHRLWESHGLAAPLFLYREMIAVDLEWGLFRPAYWAYPIIYSLPIGLAHGLRLLMVAAAVVLPLMVLRRRGWPPAGMLFGLALMALASIWLYDGLILLSIQEVTGAALVAVGAVARTGRVRTVCWLLAAWFKSPFSWLLVGQAFVLWRRGLRKQAVLSAALGLGTLVGAWLFARVGGYTSDRATIDYGFFWRMSQNVVKLLDWDTALLLGVVVWWLLWTRSRLRLRGIGVAVAIGWVGYTAQMLPWGVTGYYRGPILYLLGLFLLLSLTKPSTGFAPRRLALISAVPLLVAVGIVGTQVSRALTWSETWRVARECITPFSSPRVLLPSDYGPEGAVRLGENALIANPEWKGSVAIAGSTDLNAESWDAFVAVDGFANASGPEGMQPLCSGGLARVYIKD